MGGQGGVVRLDDVRLFSIFESIPTDRPVCAAISVRVISPRPLIRANTSPTPSRVAGPP